MCKIFLDDIRQPSECIHYMHQRIGKLNPIYLEDWVVVRNYDEFVDTVTNNINEITHVSFDHDLAEIHYDPRTWTESFKYHEKTGHDCAVWFKEFYTQNNKEYPIMFVHSLNPVGCQNIINVFQKN